MQVEFGNPFLFLTVTPDDGGSWVVSCFSGLNFNPGESVEDMSPDEICKRAQDRYDFRMKYPGYGSIWYREVMDAVWMHIIGWDFNKNCATEKPGLYGFPEAVLESTEEQSRKRLHGHCLVWIKGAPRPF